MEKIADLIRPGARAHSEITVKETEVSGFNSFAVRCRQCNAQMKLIRAGGR